MGQIELFRSQESYTFGRGPVGTKGDGVDFRYPVARFSTRHCTIKYDSKTGDVVVQDHSINGTYISSVLIGRNKTRVLREGNDLSLGRPAPDTPTEDYRWVYRHLGRISTFGELETRYDLGAELGRGGFASVYRCMDRSSGCWYAVKILHYTKLASKPLRIKHIHREIDLLPKLDHPNIVKFVELFQDSKNYYLVMEEVRGGELFRRMKRGSPEEAARRITYQICNAMRYLHSKGITHRDLKPQNILLTLDSPPTVKVADFGLAKLVDDGTFLKTVCGTPQYLAPETTRGGYDHRVDSWSVGVICFEMLTKFPVFDNEMAFLPDGSITPPVINWEALKAGSKISGEPIQFIRLLLQEDPQRRMTLTEATGHSWLFDLEVASNAPTTLLTMQNIQASSWEFSQDIQSTAHEPKAKILGPEPTLYEDPPRQKDDCSQEFENLRLGNKEPMPRNIYYEEMNSRGELKIPGFPSGPSDDSPQETSIPTVGLGSGTTMKGKAPMDVAHSRQSSDDSLYGSSERPDHSQSSKQKENEGEEIPDSSSVPLRSRQQATGSLLAIDSRGSGGPATRTRERTRAYEVAESTTISMTRKASDKSITAESPEVEPSPAERKAPTRRSSRLSGK